MRTQSTIITLLLVVLLAGCSVKKEHLQRVHTELDETKQALEQSRSEVSKFKEELTSAEKESARLKSELSSASTRVNELMAQVDMLKNQDTYAFMEAGRLADSGDLDGALRAYTAFVRDFPSSTQASAARAQISEIEQRTEAQRRETAVRAERERQERARKELAERIQNGALTPQEWAPILRGKSMQEVKALLGVPKASREDGMEWWYRNKFKNPLSDTVTTIIIYFGNDGKVRAFSESSGSQIRP